MFFDTCRHRLKRRPVACTWLAAVNSICLLFLSSTTFDLLKVANFTFVGKYEKKTKKQKHLHWVHVFFAVHVEVWQRSDGKDRKAICFHATCLSVNALLIVSPFAGKQRRLFDTQMQWIVSSNFSFEKWFFIIIIKKCHLLGGWRHCEESQSIESNFFVTRFWNVDVAFSTLEISNIHLLGLGILFVAIYWTQQSTTIAHQPSYTHLNFDIFENNFIFCVELVGRCWFTYHVIK